MESHGRSFFPIQEIGDICNSPGALKFKYVKLLLPPIHPIYTSYRPVSLALQPFTETWKKLCRLLTSFNVRNVMKNSLFYVKPHNFWMEIECLMNWKMVMEEERRSPFPGSKFSIHFCLSLCSQQLKGFEIVFFLLPIFRYRFLPKACFATHSSFDWKVKYLMGMIDAYEIALKLLFIMKLIIFFGWENSFCFTFLLLTYEI